MAFDRSFLEQNRAATERIRVLAGKLTEADLQQRMGEHWTVAIALVHLAFWDRRALLVLDLTEKAGKLSAPGVDLVVNDLSLPIWAEVKPLSAPRLCLEAAQAFDKRLEEYPEDLLEQVFAYNERWVLRSIHRNTHLDEVDEVLKG